LGDQKILWLFPRRQVLILKHLTRFLKRRNLFKVVDSSCQPIPHIKSLDSDSYPRSRDAGFIKPGTHPATSEPFELESPARDWSPWRGALPFSARVPFPWSTSSTKKSFDDLQLLVPFVQEWIE